VTLWAADTSIAVPLLGITHPLYEITNAVVGRRKPHLAGHAYFETYSVLTRLPGDSKTDPAITVQLIETNFGQPLLLSEAMARRAARIFAELGISGRAVYDGLVALAAQEHKAVLLTRDTRASAVYDAIGVEQERITN